MSEIRAELVPGSVWSVTFNNPETGETIEPSGPGMMALEFNEHGVVTRMYPAEEQRGGADPDWDKARPGEELPVKPEPETWDGLDE